jgi:hypothetical protein
MNIDVVAAAGSLMGEAERQQQTCKIVERQRAPTGEKGLPRFPRLHPASQRRACLSRERRSLSHSGNDDDRAQITASDSVADGAARERSALP